MKKLSEYTKQERNELYKKAKEIYIEDEYIRNNIEFRAHKGMCDAMAEIIIEENLGFHPTEDVFKIGDTLPEMKTIKPDELHKPYWWPEKNTEIRIKMFDKIIKMTDV